MFFVPAFLFIPAPFTPPPSPALLKHPQAVSSFRTSILRRFMHTLRKNYNVFTPGRFKFTGGGLSGTDFPRHSSFLSCFRKIDAIRS